MIIGIVGQGFVGSAIREGLSSFYPVMTYDIDSKKCSSTHSAVCKNADIIFVCLPTPMRKSGECDTRILEESIKLTDEECKRLNRNPTIVIKSTVPPGTTEGIDNTVSLDVCFSPEFLTEANSFDDFKNQTRIVVGGTGAKKVKQMFRKPFPNIPIVITKSQTAEMVKYFINCFLSSKVIFANQMYDICNALDIDYDKVCEYAILDNRLGRSHFAVPGPDGDRGFGGHCFPKDLSALIYSAKAKDANTEFLDQVRDSNKRYRKNKDWLDMKGRAVSDD
jgi:UDPglucose 6-dehydrogenase